MKLFGFVKRKSKKAAGIDIYQMLIDKGIITDEREFNETFEKLNKIDVKLCFPELCDGIADLESTDSGYQLKITAFLIDGYGNLPDTTTNEILTIAKFYATISEVAKLKNITQFVLKEKEKVRIGKVIGSFGWIEHEPHALQTIVPNLEEKLFIKI